MEEFRPYLLAVWREVCRHLDIAQSTANVTEMLVKHLPLEQLLVRQIDQDQGCLETVAVGLPAGGHPAGDGRNECPAAAMKDLVAWCRQGEVYHRARQPEATVAAAVLAPGVGEADLLAGPLGDPDGCSGVLLLVAQPGQTFDQRHAALVQILMEPFSTALENDHRIRELIALREANATAGEIVSLDEAMRRHVEKALTATGGRIEGPRGAAAILDINPHTLRARMRKLGIDWSRFRT